ncbi:MAG: hypothetical protein CJBNEKGG_03881 [Prosthecobacter sp.]|nr:hypothetical protein [Prosthecobacter sp.]
MKPTRHILFSSLMLLISASAWANPVVRRLAQQALQASADKAAATMSREAVELAAANAVRVMGSEAAERAVQRGGISFLQAGMHYGDDVLRTASRVPEAAGFVGASPEQALLLAKRYGDHALRLEARAPGMAELAVQRLGRESLPALAQTSPRDVTRLVGLAEKADSPATRDALWAAWKREGGAFLDRLDQHKALILTGGLTTSMILVADGVQDAVQDMPQKAPEAVLAFAQKLGSGISTSLIIVSSGALCLLAAWLWHRRPLKRP